MITPPVAKMKAAVEQKFAADFAAGRLRDLGVYNRRLIRGTTIWSQHAWGNAWDIGIHPDHRPGLGDRVVAFLRAEDRAGRLDVGTILWQVRDHFDHIHAEGSPKKTGVPPLPKEDDMETVAHIQSALIAAGYDLGDFTPFSSEFPPGADGDWGSKTQAAFVAALKKTAALPVGVLKSGDTVKVTKG